MSRTPTHRFTKSPFYHGLLAACGLTTGEQDRLAGRLKSEEWLALSLTPVKSAPVFEYRTREGEYIPFRNASAGQQATALLKTLLNQAGPPLIIDQPEEDLDNPVMLEIVGRVWQAKQNRQLIFASHNANLVVNGDAELVAWCDYRMAGDQSRGTIVGEGAIDIPGVREAIKKIGSSQRSVQFWSVSMANKSSIVSDLHGWRTPSVSGEELQAPGKSGPQ